MPKKHHTRRHLRGGFGESVMGTFSNLGNSITQGATNLWNTTKKGVSSLTTSSSGSTNTYTPSYSAPTSTYRGGKKYRRTKRSKRSRTVKRGGFNPNVPFLADRVNGQISSLTSSALANNAAPFSGTSASAQYVGGKKKKTKRLRR